MKKVECIEREERRPSPGSISDSKRKLQLQEDVVEALKPLFLRALDNNYEHEMTNIFTIMKSFAEQASRERQGIFNAEIRKEKCDE